MIRVKPVSQIETKKVSHPNSDSDIETEEKPVSPFISLTAVEGKSHLTLKSGLTLVELQVTSNCSPFLRITVSFWDSAITGGTSGTARRDKKATLS